MLQSILAEITKHVYKEYWDRQNGKEEERGGGRGEEEEDEEEDEEEEEEETLFSGIKI